MDDVTIKVEPLDGVIGELDNILHGYWKQTEASKDTPALAMDWPFYDRLERAGAYVVLVARRRDEVLGFVQYVILNNPHHKSTRLAQCDILAVRLGLRGHGLGAQLVKAGEQELRKRGVYQVVHAFRLVYDREPLFPKLGYKPIETLYMKVL